jgi:iron complex transport system substrate-binding protein
LNGSRLLPFCDAGLIRVKTLKLWMLIGLFAATISAGGSVRASDRATPQRIISTAPSITETIYALGQQDRLVGVTSYCDYPPEAQSKTIIGDFASPNIETILRLRPDLVVLLSDRGDVLEKLRPFHLKTLVLTQNTLEDIFDSIRTLADRIGCSEKGRALTQRLSSQLEEIRADQEGHPRPRVLFIVSRTPGALNEIYTVGRKCYIGQLIELAGGDNVFAEAGGFYPKVSVEEILARNPDIIIDMSMGGAESEQQAEQVRSLWKDFPSIGAARTGRIFALDSDVFIIPGPRVVQAAERLAVLFRQ